MDLRTFLRPPPLPLGVRLARGDIAPPLPVEHPAGPCIVAFLRHVGCPMAEATLLEMERRALRHTYVSWIAVSHGTAEASAAWHRQVVPTPRVQLMIDTERLRYAAWGLGTTRVGHFLQYRSLAGALRLARAGIRNRHPSGSRWQSAGAFALRERIVACHYPEHAADLPDFDAQLRALADG